MSRKLQLEQKTVATIVSYSALSHLNITRLLSFFQRFRDEQLNYLRMDREYRKERKEIVNSVEKEHARSQYQPWGKPGGGAPAITTRRTKEMELKEKTNHPGKTNKNHFKL